MFTRLFSTAAASLLFVGLAACAADMDQPESSDGATASASETLPIDPRVDKFKTACESCKGCSVFTTQDNGCTVYHCGCDSTAGAVCASKAVDGALSASMETVGTGGAGGSGTKFQNAAIVASDLGAVLDSGSGSAGAGGSASGSTVKHPAGWGKTCGGIAAFACSSGLVCVDDPRDACDPKKGGADCGGVCVTQAEAKLLGTSCSATGSCAEGLICQLPSNPICSKANVDCHRTCGLPLPTKTLVKALPF